MDGSRRGKLLIKLFGLDFKVTCAVFNNLSREEEEEIMVLASQNRENLSLNDIEELIRKRNIDPVLLGRTPLHQKILKIANLTDKSFKETLPEEINYRKQPRRKTHTSGVYTPIGSETKYLKCADILVEEKPEKIIILYGESPIKLKKETGEVLLSETAIALKYAKEENIPITIVQGKYENWKSDLTRDYVKGMNIEKAEVLSYNVDDYLWKMRDLDTRKGLIYINGADFTSIRPNIIKLLRDYFPFYTIYAIFIDSPIVWEMIETLKRELIYIYGVNYKPCNLEEFVSMYEKKSNNKLSLIWKKDSQVQNASLYKIERR